MDQNSASHAEAYYTAVGEKNIAALEKHLHPDVEFVGPLAKMTGRDKVLEATRKFAALFRTLKIRSKFGAGNQAVVIYDLEFPEPIGSVSSASLMTFDNDTVVKIELFYDASPFVQ